MFVEGKKEREGGREREREREKKKKKEVKIETHKFDTIDRNSIKML